ncbi:MAG: formate--phosphoribosylaminoimidazolecarboxamide ligase [Candidatus Micrarchaeota archaeon]|nr:formate--phosphoribosylaminoimidazolecarboxamide ligase [Candidatus Micrarchaeota archaeon]
MAKTKAGGKLCVATLGSHSALQILKGAKDEGFETVCVTTPNRTKLYSAYKFIDEVMEIPSFKEFDSVEDELARRNAVVVPHGSFVEYLGMEANKKMRTKYFGNKHILDWETDREKQRKWLSMAGLRLPKQIHDAADIQGPTIVKLYGAKGGKGYFFVKNKREFDENIKKLPAGEKISIQEYIIGVPLYIHYFYSPLDKKLEIMSMDIRYESNVDSLGRIPSKHQWGFDVEPSYVVVGNKPVVLRESMLAEAFSMAERTIKASQKVCPPRGLFGPFCLETVITPKMEFYVIEISARIVAGTNLFINGSPYADLLYNEPMSTGRRVAREIRNAEKQGRLDEILD